MLLELNDVHLSGITQGLTMIAREGEVTCLAAPSSPGACPLRWLHAIMGFEAIESGFISFDGEPLTLRSAPMMRQLMAFVPSALPSVGHVTVYSPPTVQQLFSLKSNRHLPISNGLLKEEMHRTGVSGPQAQLLAVGVLLKRPILLADNPPTAAENYLFGQAQAGLTVVVTSSHPAYTSTAHQVVRIPDNSCNTL